MVSLRPRRRFPRRRILIDAANASLDTLEQRLLFDNTCPDRPDETPIDNPPCTTCPCIPGPSSGPGRGGGGGGGGGGGSGGGGGGGGSGQNAGVMMPFQPGAISSRPIRYYDGMPLVESTDLVSNGFGRDWGVVRSWSGLNNTGPVGNGWTVKGLPYLVIQSTVGSPDLVAEVEGGMSTRLFEVNISGSFTVSARYYTQEKLEYVPPAGTNSGEFVMTDSAGDVMRFYDLPRDGFGNLSTSIGWAQEITGDHPYGGFKSFTDPAANVTQA